MASVDFQTPRTLISIGQVLELPGFVSSEPRGDQVRGGWIDSWPGLLEKSFIPGEFGQRHIPLLQVSFTRQPIGLVLCHHWERPPLSRACTPPPSIYVQSSPSKPRASIAGNPSSPTEKRPTEKRNPYSQPQNLVSGPKSKP